MKRRINHTGRQKIDKSNITIRLIDQAPKPLKFTAKLVLEKQELPNNAKVFVEAYHKNTTQRFDFGTVENITPPTDTTLNEVDPQGTTKFRIMVVDNKQQPGKLLAGAINISAVNQGEEEDKDALIIPKTRDIGDTPWKLEITMDETPVLLLNNKIPDVLNRLYHPLFRSLLLPGVVREVFMNIFWNGDDGDNSLSWQSKWLEFGKKTTGLDFPEVRDSDPFEITEWIDEVISKLCGEHKITDKLIDTLSDEEN